MTLRNFKEIDCSWDNIVKLLEETLSDNSIAYSVSINMYGTNPIYINCVDKKQAERLYYTLLDVSSIE